MNKKTLERISELFQREFEANKSNHYRGTCQKEFESDIKGGRYSSQGYWASNARQACGHAYIKGVERSSNPIVVFSKNKDKWNIPLLNLDTFDISDENEVQKLVETLDDDWDKFVIREMFEGYKKGTFPKR